jgi:hypothetical protein
VGGLRETKSESLGSTGGGMDEWGATIITATAANMVYSLPTPLPGKIKWVSVNYTGNADDLIIACETTAQGFDNSTANIITVSSSQEHMNFLFYGLSTAQWGVIGTKGRADFASTAIGTQDWAFSASTIKSTTDVT